MKDENNIPNIQVDKNQLDKNGWSTYEKLVLSELQRHNDWLQKLDEKFANVQLQITKMETQVQAKSVIMATLTTVVISPIVGALAVFIMNNLK